MTGSGATADVIWNMKVIDTSGTVVHSGNGTANNVGEPKANLDGFSIGSTSNWNSNQWDGDIAEVAFWDRELSDDEMANLASGYVQTAGWPSLYVPMYSKPASANALLEIGSSVGATNTRITDWTPTVARGGFSGLTTSPHPPVPPPFPIRAYSFPTAILVKQGFIIKWGDG